MISLKDFIGKSVLIVASVFCISSCDFLKFKNESTATEFDENQPLASVGDIFLFPKDITGIVPKGISKNDSIDLVERHIESWIKKQLLILEAQKQFVQTPCRYPHV